MLKSIKNDKQYNQALAQVYALMQLDVQKNSEAANELEALSILVKEYENKHYPLPEYDALKTIKSK